MDKPYFLPPSKLETARTARPAYQPPRAKLLDLRRPLSLLQSFSLPSDWEDIEEGLDLDADTTGLEY